MDYRNSVMDELDKGDYFELPVEGRYVEWCCVGQMLVLKFSTIIGTPSVELQIWTPFTIFTPPTQVELDPQTRDELGPAMLLCYKVANRARAYKAGLLEVLFDDGTRVAAEAHPKYEAWGVALKTLPDDRWITFGVLAGGDIW